MPKHSKEGLGAALKKAQRKSRIHPSTGWVADAHGDELLRSTVAQHDLEAIMDLAQLASRDFRANRGDAQVLDSSHGRWKDPQTRIEAQKEHVDAVRVPRRPPWTRDMTVEELDEVERASFLEWRRDLAEVEQDSRVQLTPFEKNLQVWRQLWRVLERSNLVVQVIDARDPLRFLCEDLAKYAKEIDDTKETVLLLNKADLVPLPLRRAWSVYLRQRGWQVLFWSAKIADEEIECNQASGIENDEGDARVLQREELLVELEKRARQCLPEPAESQPVSRVVVGMVGYPNVGKSSTVNAMVGSKKTRVAAMPGKTKHFQTLNIGDGLCVCDSPGLVFPQYAASKEDMVVAGVMPIDNLTDSRATVEVILSKVSRQTIEQTYGIKLPTPASHEDPTRAPTAAEVLRAYCLKRGFVVASGLPDETRASRQLLRDFTSGKLLHCETPPGHEGEVFEHLQISSCPDDSHHSGKDYEEIPTETNALASIQQSNSGIAADNFDNLHIGEADLEAERSLTHAEIRNKPRRPEYKFQKKKVRSKGNRGQALDSGMYDGSALATGKKGGVKRA